MAKSKSQPAKPFVPKKGGDGGRIRKPGVKTGQTKATAKAVLAAAAVQVAKLKAVRKPGKVAFAVE